MTSLGKYNGYGEYKVKCGVPQLLIRFQVMSKQKGSQLSAALGPFIYASLGYELDIVRNPEHLKLFCNLCSKYYNVIFPKKGVDQKTLYFYDRENQNSIEVIEKDGVYQI